MTDFSLNCSRGDTVNITKYTFVDDVVSNYKVRKFNPRTGAYAEVEGASLTRETLGASVAIKLSYSIQDGGTYDQDGVANGVIVDPTGLATTVSSLANTGITTVSSTLLLGIIFGSLAYTIYDYRRHKKPLVAEDEHVRYTYLHHLKVVTVPLLRYRLSVQLERTTPRKSIHS